MPSVGRFAPAVVLFAGVVGLQGAKRQASTPLVHPLSGLPVVVAGYRGTDRAVDSGSVRVAGMTNYLFRVYASDTTPAFSLYVGYYDNQTTGRTIHSPRNCLPGAGWQVLSSGPVDVDSTTVNRYVLANGDAQAVVYYWYQGRGRVAWNEYRVKWDLLRDAAARRRSEEALVRIVVPIRGVRTASNDWASRLARADALAQQVAREMLPAVDRVLPPWERRA
ncbi:MAG: EpsI family protein [Gemmatimonadaceae bacterium]